MLHLINIMAIKESWSLKEKKSSLTIQHFSLNAEFMQSEASYFR